MTCFKHGMIIDLKVRESLLLPDVRGSALRVTRGTVWITQENDTQDIVLRAGDTWVVEKDGLTILEAQGHATLAVVGRKLESFVLPPLAGAGTAAKIWRHVCEAVTAFYATPARKPVPYV